MDCKHGQPELSCETCDLEKDRDAWEEIARGNKEECDLAIARAEKAERERDEARELSNKELTETREYLQEAHSRADVAVSRMVELRRERDEARAEIGLLYDRLGEEQFAREASRAEVTRLTRERDEAVARAEKAEAELIELREVSQHVARGRESVMAMNDDLEAENTRLCVALESMAAEDCEYGGDYGCGCTGSNVREMCHPCQARSAQAKK